MDIEDRVRVAACKTFGSLEYEVVTHHVGVSSLKVIGDRLRDKKVGLVALVFPNGTC